MFAFGENAGVGGFIVCEAGVADLSGRGSYSERCETLRIAHRAADHIRADHQPEDPEDALPHVAADAARPIQRDDRMGSVWGTRCST